MQYIIPYLQQITKNFRFPSKTNTFHQTEDWGGPSFPQSFIPLTPWATKWLMRLACTGRWNLSSSKVWRDDTGYCKLPVSDRMGGWLFLRWHPGIPTSKWFFGTTRITWSIVGNVFWREVMSKQHMEVTYDYFYGTKEIYIIWRKISQMQVSHICLKMIFTKHRPFTGKVDIKWMILTSKKWTLPLGQCN